MCFNEGTKILYLNKQKKDEYISVELLKKGNLIKTFRHGYRKIDLIGKNILINDPSIASKCMYKMPKTETNELLEDLIVTGNHSIMVDSIPEQVLKQNISKIDNKYLLLSSASDHFEQITTKKPYVYYQLVLDNEHDDDAMYGIWANGILTETPSKQFFKKQKFILSK
jgi:hypothetical protein